MHNALKDLQPQSSYELLEFLKRQGYLKDPPHLLWWPGAGGFEISIASILGQNTKWENAKKVLEVLREKGVLECDKLASLSQEKLLGYMAGLGLRNAKSERILALTRAILRDFGSYENYHNTVSREWLLAQKGVGEETADSILCYGLLRDEMVADSYSQRLLGYCNYTLESYGEVKEWLQRGILENYDKVCRLYDTENIPLNTVYARFHGKIVEFCKDNPKVVKRKKDV